MIEDHNQRIWALLSGYLQDPQEIKRIARVLNDDFIPRVIGVLKKFGVDEVTGEDIAKEALDKAARAYEPGRAKFITFVTGIALNIRIDRYRRGLLQPAQMQSLGSDTPVHVFEDASVIDDPPEDSEFVKRVRTIFPLLSQEDRILIQLDIQGVSKESYMELFGIGEQAYRQRKSRAYRRLKMMYGKEFPLGDKR
ncbi:MAG: sigma-70 family RNA polymerase sigma factor [Ignavibacteria bacterium]|nr:sigma-70 family RNA polymerase sigma factor [Ignavibacteria bacterium]